MEYGFKPTTRGRALKAKCAALEKPFLLTRVAVGSGRVSEGTNLADVHELVQYVADGKIEHRRHKDDRFFFTVQYSNDTHPELPAFDLSEFIVFGTDPETGAEVDVLYATLGDYTQSVPAYSPEHAPSICNFPVVLIISDELEVYVETPPGLVTYEDLQKEVREACEDIGGLFRTLNLVIPVSAWIAAEHPSNDHMFVCDIADADVRKEHIPSGAVTVGGFQAASRAGMVGGCETFDGYIRFYAKKIPKRDISACVHLFRMGRVQKEDAGDSDGSGGTDGPTVDDTPDGYAVAETENVSQMLNGVFGS